MEVEVVGEVAVAAAGDAERLADGAAGAVGGDQVVRGQLVRLAVRFYRSTAVTPPSSWVNDTSSVPSRTDTPRSWAARRSSGSSTD